MIAEPGSVPFKNARWENFVQIYAQNPNQADAYRAAGFKPKTAGSAYSAASLLLSKIELQTRVEWLRAQAAKRKEVTIDSLLGELEDARVGAMESRQHAAAVSATREKGVLTGLRVERRSDDGPKSADARFVSIEDLAGEFARLIRERAGLSNGIAGTLTGTGGSGQLRLVDRNT